MKASRVEPLSASALKVRVTIARGFNVFVADPALSAGGDEELMKETKRLRHSDRSLCQPKRDIAPPPITPTAQGRDCRCVSGGSDLFHRLGLRPFGALGDLKLDLVAFIQGLEARRGDGRIVDKDIRPLILGDEAKPFLVVKPLHGAMRHHMILLA
jgi:hypothetical protein